MQSNLAKAFVPVIVAAVAGALAVTAAAATPVVVQKHAELTRHFTSLPLCPGFTVSATFAVTRTDTLYYDGNGNLVREVFDVKFDGTWSNDSTGATLQNNGTRHITDDYVTQTTTEDGVLRHITVAGTGIVLHQSGRSVVSWSGTPPPAFDDDVVIFQAGPHQDATGDFAAFCAALS